MPGRLQIGILGGSFNPVHCGHMMLASWLAQFTSLNEVWMVLSPENPLKHPDAVSASHRLAMLEIANYTIVTLRELKRLCPEYEFRLIIGSDNWEIFSQWRNHEEIIDEFSPIIYPRPQHDIDPSSLPAGVDVVNAPQMEISSTMIRRAIAEGKNMNHFLPSGVYNYIIKHHLYR